MRDKLKYSYKCDECQTVFEGTKAYYVWRHKEQQPNRKGFCSKECSRKHNIQIRLELSCKTCDKKILRLPKDIVGEVFCSTSCAAKYNNVRRHVDNEKEIKEAIDSRRSFAKTGICFGCGIALAGKKAYQKYCSRKCNKKYEYDNYIEEWKTGKISGGDSIRGKTSKQVRRYVFEKYQHKCARCGWNEINSHSNKSPLQIEHIDGNAYNQKEENLILLCPNCHSLTPTYGALNAGNGRKNRKNLTYK